MVESFFLIHSDFTSKGTPNFPLSLVDSHQARRQKKVKWIWRARFEIDIYFGTQLYCKKKKAKTESDGPYQPWDKSEEFLEKKIKFE